VEVGVKIRDDCDPGPADWRQGGIIGIFHLLTGIAKRIGRVRLCRGVDPIRCSSTRFVDGLYNHSGSRMFICYPKRPPAVSHIPAC